MKVLTEKKAEDYLKKYVPVAKSTLTKTREQALKFSKKYPQVLKIISKQALHKSDINGVRIVQDQEELERNYHQLELLAKQKRIKLEGILVQEYIKGQEVIIGIKEDHTFNHVIMFGIGGTLVELIKDVQFRMCPIDEKEAQDMIDQLRLGQVLKGYRNIPKTNISLLKKTLVKLSRMPMENIKELDINPLIINQKQAIIADARLILS